jgi:hypothetical protein
MHWPFCAGGSFPPCAAASPSYRAQDTCVPLRFVNRTGHVIETTAVDGADTGISLAPGGKADAYVSPSRSGATIVAAAASTPAGRRCEWRVAIRGCLEPGVRRRVVFRQSAASCGP